jgi:hypothetical protein
MPVRLGAGARRDHWPTQVSTRAGAPILLPKTTAGNTVSFSSGPG